VLKVRSEVVVTGIGVVSPIGIGLEAFAEGLAAGRSAVRRLDLFQADDLPIPLGAVVECFDPKQFVRPRKSLKVMSRDIQLAFAAADMACADARLRDSGVDPDRLGIVFGADLIPCELEELVATYRSCMVDGRFDFSRWGEAAMTEMFPLWMLKYLPNMPACHVGIAHDARGPNNSLTLAEVSSLSAIAEAMRVIDRGQADVMIAGGAGSRVHPTILFRSEACQLNSPHEDPATVCRPFDAKRRGMVNGEGAGVVVLESRRHAEARGAKIYCRILGYAATFEPRANGAPMTGKGIGKAIAGALREAGLSAEEVGHVNAHGLSTLHDDKLSARCLATCRLRRRRASSATSGPVREPWKSSPAFWPFRRALWR
jgi:3-oxoacyl-[acyl-carrier-protein] synthase II